MAEPRRSPAGNAPADSLRYVLGAATAFVSLICFSPAAFAADAIHGAAIAKRWCAACHLVSSDQTKANADVPSFAAIAQKKETNEELRSFLISPHPKMPDMSLSRSEIEDIVAYIRSLDQ